MTRAFAVLRSRRVNQSRSVHAFAHTALRNERLELGRKRRDFIRIERPHQARRNKNHQLSLLGPFRLGFEQVPDDRNLAEKRNGRRIVLRNVVEEAGDGERLAIPQLHIGLRTSCRQCRDSETTERDAVRKIKRADYRRNFQPNHVAGNGWRERQPDAELLELYGHGSGSALHDGHGKLAAGEKTGFLAVVSDQIRLREALEMPRGLKGPYNRAEVVLGVQEEKVQEVAEYEITFLLCDIAIDFRGLHVAESRSRELLRRRTSPCVPESVSRREQGHTELAQRTPIDFREANLQKDLLALASAGHLQHVDDLALRGRCRCDFTCAQHDTRARHVPRKDCRILVGADLDVLAREERLELLLQRGDRLFHHEVIL